MTPDIPPDLARHAAGPAGALTAMLFMAGVPIWRRLVLAMAGGVAAIYGAPVLVSAYPALQPEGAGYLLGLCGMAIVAKAAATWEALELGSLLRRKLAALMGVQE